MPAEIRISPTIGHTSRVAVGKIDSVVCNRFRNGLEEFLIRWETGQPTKTKTPPLSWHPIHQLSRCLEAIQDYLDLRRQPAIVAYHQGSSRKRKSPDTGSETGTERRLSPFRRRLQPENQQLSLSRSLSVSSTSQLDNDVYNGVLDCDENGFIFCRPVAGTPKLDIHTIPNSEMMRVACNSKVETTNMLIRAEYVRRLRKVPGKPISLFNPIDASTPSLRFRYITDYVLGQGVHRASLEAQPGCQSCSPNMGQDIGCEYTQKCDCLEYAAVNLTRMTDQQKTDYNRAERDGGSTMGFPKRFPYFAKGTNAEGCLVSFYLDSRNPIYECNSNCRCGPKCRNKNVQFGRTVEVEIFKTPSSRGWGLRCKEDLRKGQFIDTYRGEVITNAEASRREAGSSKAKASYLYSLDKFNETEKIDPEDTYVVDGEFMGGPTKFINHSCEPNCRQHTVSYNKYDCKVYDLAFFALRFIPAGEELTFDYLDKDENDDHPLDEPGEDAVPCLCGAQKCRKWLWDRDSNE